MKMDDAEIKKLAIRFKIKDNGIPYGQFKKGISVEREHGPKNGGVSSKTNVTGGSLLKTAKIAFAHLKESPGYYRALSRMESNLKKGKGLGRGMKNSCPLKGKPEKARKSLHKGLSKGRKG